MYRRICCRSTPITKLPKIGVTTCWWIDKINIKASGTLGKWKLGCWPGKYGNYMSNRICTVSIIHYQLYCVSACRCISMCRACCIWGSAIAKIPCAAVCAGSSSVSKRDRVTRTGCSNARGKYGYKISYVHPGYLRKCITAAATADRDQPYCIRARSCIIMCRWGSGACPAIAEIPLIAGWSGGSIGKCGRNGSCAGIIITCRKACHRLWQYTDIVCFGKHLAAAYPVRHYQRYAEISGIGIAVGRIWQRTRRAIAEIPEIAGCAAAVWCALIGKLHCFRSTGGRQVISRKSYRWGRIGHNVSDRGFGAASACIAYRQRYGIASGRDVSSRWIL